MISISHSPNSNWKQQLSAIALLLTPWRWKNGEADKKLKKALSFYHDGAEVALFSTGRNALYAILQALDVSSGDEVIIQAYTCIVVPNSVLWTGAKPVYVDIDDSYNLNPEELESKITKNTKAIIVQHTFGYPAKMEAIIRIAEEHNIPIIEDCAHSLGAKANGKRVGTIGIASIVSFGRDKIISSISGGATITADQGLAKKLASMSESSPMPSSTFIFQNLLHPLLLPWMARLIGKHKVGQLLIRITQSVKLLNKVYRKNECNAEPPKLKTQKLPNAMASLAFEQLSDLDKNLQSRKEHAEFYKAELEQQHFRTQEVNPNTEPAYLRYTIELDTPESLMKTAYEKGFILGNWYNEVIMPRPKDWQMIAYTPGSCPISEALVKRNINLPTQKKLTKKKQNTLIQIIKNNAT